MRSSFSLGDFAGERTCPERGAPVRCVGLASADRPPAHAVMLARLCDSPPIVGPLALAVPGLR